MRVERLRSFKADFRNAPKRCTNGLLFLSAYGSKEERKNERERENERDREWVRERDRKRETERERERGRERERERERESRDWMIIEEKDKKRGNINSK